MNGFFRTVAGKAILFILCTVSVIMIGASILGIVAAYEFEFYYKSEETVYDEFIRNMALNDWTRLTNDENAESSGGIRNYTEDTGNIIFEVYDSDNRIIEQSKNASISDRMDFSYDYEIELFQSPYSGEKQIKSARTGGRSVRYAYYTPDAGETVHLKISFIKDMPETDIYGLDYKLFHIGYALRYKGFIIAGIAALTAVACFIGLMCVSARRKDDEELHPGPLNIVPFDIILAVTLIIGVALIALVDSIVDYFGFWEYYSNEILRNVFAAIAGIAAIVGLIMLALGLCMGIAARVKQHNLLKNTVIYHLVILLGRFAKKLLGFIGRFIKNVFGIIVKLPMVWKTVLPLSILMLIDIVVIAGLRRDADVLLGWFIISRLIILGGAAFLILKLKTLRQGAEALARGDLNYRTETKGLFLDLKEHAENLNHISEGMTTVVEQRLKSERMKTELITNVSHDIKTPLTSIINYVGLIAKEECNNEKHAEYCEVLTRQSNRLKKLIEDLVEASKASTGNLDVQLAPCDAGVFLTQASGEYDEKLQAADLTLIVKEPEEKLTIMADGRRMWRIFDNLMNNICKYSMPGTRVYLTLERDGNAAKFLFKNTSKEVLDISEDELMERFVRGDSSRNTEGNGLGLSIAKSMAQLQNGNLSIETDGDLFKAVLTFPLV